MLRINLLPNEFRQAERTPLGTFMLLVACTILSVSALCCTAFMYFGILKEAETKRDIAQEEHENLAPMAKYADDLEAEQREYKKRSEVIKEIETTRILWTRKLDQFLDVINSKDNLNRHWVWLSEMKVRMTGSKEPGVELKGFAAGDQYEQLSNFNEDLKNHELYPDDFVAISNPTGSIVVNEKMNPAYAIEFDWTLRLDDKVAGTASNKPKPKPKPKPAAQGADGAGSNTENK
jgi:Tfp pilus assembly protein PilN